MTDIKVYTPTTIEETPLPQEAPLDYAATTPATGKAGGQTFSPSTVADQPLPKKKIAHELLSTVLNTKSKKILQEIQFTKQGAIQIGDYTEGVSGDIRISPNGVVARDNSGNTTFSLDGDTGDGTFAGTIRAGATIINSNIVTEAASSGNGRTVYYNDGIPAIVIGDPS